ncbi:hypothetical protein AVEN_248259-1 [Araneus ventricosus]|uniref:Thyroglobulin type-1 domain-containing protein n=1 Tax=Araneus ventricosus TaxID=182803 RepID=A0A4Y2U3C0_ARAVE|nr:hypothetical protein AVEN_248259-1 [Araneus ventricosus]
MKIILTALFACLLPAVLCWEFPGYPGVDCPTARRKMSEDPKNGWMLPKCNTDGTYQEMQCFDIDDPDACMCTYQDGSPLTLPGFGVNISSCVCIVVGWDKYLLGRDHGYKIVVEVAESDVFSGNLVPERTCEPADHRGGTPANFQRTGPLSLPNYSHRGEHHEYVDEKSPDEYADSSFPGAHSNGTG